MEIIVAAFKSVWKTRFAAIFLFSPLSASHQVEPFNFAEVLYWKILWTKISRSKNRDSPVVSFA